MGRILYRTMIEDDDGLPKIGKTGRYLAVRPGSDLPVDGEGRVKPGTGGMSCAPDIMGLDPLHRPIEYDGVSEDTSYLIDEGDLYHLSVRIIPRKLPKGLIEPDAVRLFGEYEEHIHATRAGWRKP